MLEKNDICKLKGEKGKTYVVLEQIFEDDKVTLRGYKLYSNFSGGIHWVRPEGIRKQRKKRGRKKRPQTS